MKRSNRLRGVGLLRNLEIVFVAGIVSKNELELGKIIAKAWRDPAFKAALIANPAAALKAEGIDVPAGMTVTVVENTDKQFHLVLPPEPSDELSDEALDGVAGGGTSGLCNSFFRCKS